MCVGVGVGVGVHVGCVGCCELCGCEFCGWMDVCVRVRTLGLNKGCDGFIRAGAVVDGVYNIYHGIVFHACARAYLHTCYLLAPWLDLT